MSWKTRWMDLTIFISQWSKDRSRKCGAIIVDDRNVLISIGWNGFPRGINDNIDARHARPAKYQWTEHAERNAIYNAAAAGHPTNNCTMFLSWFPCADCARAIIQSGIKNLVCIEPNWEDPVWAKDFIMVREMLAETSVVVEFVPGSPPVMQ